MKFVSLKTKFSLGISLLIISVFAASGYFLIQDKTKELNLDIYRQARNFAKLTVDRFSSDYRSYYISGFATFERNAAINLALNTDISKIRILDYNGNLLYDSETEANEKSADQKRKADDSELLNRIKDVRPSVRTHDTNRTTYLVISADGSMINYQNKEGVEDQGISNTETIQDIVYPYVESTGQHQLSVQYFVTYKNLEARIAKTRNNILILVALATLISIFFAINLASRIVKPLRKLTKGAREVAKGNLSHRIQVKTRDELRILALTFNKMSEDLERSIRELVDKQRIAKEVELAASIQMNLLPKKIPRMNGLDVAAGVIPASEVGGDSYDFIPTEEGKTVFYVGDVTGHGVSAGIVMAIANSLVYSFAQHVKTSKEILVSTNAVLVTKASNNIYMTVCMLMWHNAEKKLTFTGAGHEPILQYSAATKEVTKVKTGGIILGTMPDISKIAKEQELVPSIGDVLVLYTDGIPEAYSNDGKDMFGFDRFAEVIKKYSILPTAQEIYDGILKEVYEYMGDWPQQDDITLIVLKRIE